MKVDPRGVESVNCEPPIQILIIRAGDYFLDLTVKSVKQNLQQAIRDRFGEDLVVKSVEEVHQELISEGICRQGNGSLRQVEDAMLGDDNLVRLSDGRYATRTLLETGPLKLRCVQIVDALGGRAAVQDVSLFLPETPNQVSNSMSGTSAFRRIKRGRYRLVRQIEKIATKTQPRRLRKSITNSDDLSELKIEDRVILALISLARPATINEILAELSRLELPQTPRELTAQILQRHSSTRTDPSGRWRLTHTYYKSLTNAERLELAIACARRPLLTREVVTWWEERGWVATPVKVKDAAARSKIVHRLAHGIYTVTTYVGDAYADLKAQIVEHVRSCEAGATINAVATHLAIEASVVEIALRTSEEIERDKAVYLHKNALKPTQKSSAEALKQVIENLSGELTAADVVEAARLQGLSVSPAMVRDHLRISPHLKRTTRGRYARRSETATSA